MYGSGPPCSVRGITPDLEPDLDLRPARRQAQYFQHVFQRHGHTARCRAPVRPGKMQEDGAAQRRNGRIVIVSEFNNHIVDMVFQPEILVAGGVGQFDPAIVEWVIRRVAPAVFRGEWHERQQGFRGVQPVRSVEDAPHRPGARR